MSTKGLIFRQFLRNPSRIGAIAPSSPALCRELVGWLEVNKASAVAELGPGTGVVTREVLHQMGGQTRFFAVELDPEICRALRETLPEVKLYNANACDLKELCAQENIEALDAVVCGLPMPASPSARSPLAAAPAAMKCRKLWRPAATLWSPEMPSIMISGMPMIWA